MFRFPTRSLLTATLPTAAVPVIWGTTYFAAAEFLPPDRPIWTAIIRTVPAGLVLVVATRCLVPPAPLLRLLAVSIINISAFQALLFLAAQRLPGGLVATAGALQPLLMLALAWSVDRVLPRKGALLAGATAVIGMVLVFARPGTAWDLTGVLAAFAATTFMAVGGFLSRRWLGSMPVLAFAGWQLALGGLALVPLAIATEALPSSLSVRQLTGYIYLVGIGTLLAYPLWIRGLHLLPPGAIGALSLLNPVTALAIGWLLPGGEPGVREAAGVVIVIGSVLALQMPALVGHSRRRDESTHPSAETGPARISPSP